MGGCRCVGFIPEEDMLLAESSNGMALFDLTAGRVLPAPPTSTRSLGLATPDTPQVTMIPKFIGNADEGHRTWKCASAQLTSAYLAS